MKIKLKHNNRKKPISRYELDIEGINCHKAGQDYRRVQIDAGSISVDVLYNLIEDFKKFLLDEDRDYYNCEPFEFYKAQDEIADHWINAVLDYRIRTVYYYDANNEEFEVTFVE